MKKKTRLRRGLALRPAEMLQRLAFRLSVGQPPLQPAAAGIRASQAPVYFRAYAYQLRAYLGLSRDRECLSMRNTTRMLQVPHGTLLLMWMPCEHVTTFSLLQQRRTAPEPAGQVQPGLSSSSSRLPGRCSPRLQWFSTSIPLPPLPLAQVRCVRRFGQDSHQPR